MMAKDMSWLCCPGVVESDNGKQVCTKKEDKPEEPEKPMPKPCTYVEDTVCGSMCQVDGKCCPSENLMMAKDMSWMCCPGVVESDNGKQVCTKPEDKKPMVYDCTDVEDTVCQSMCQVEGKCCPSE